MLGQSKNVELIRNFSNVQFEIFCLLYVYDKKIRSGAMVSYWYLKDNMGQKLTVVKPETKRDLLHIDVITEPFCAKKEEQLYWFRKLFIIDSKRFAKQYVGKARRKFTGKAI